MYIIIAQRKGEFGMSKNKESYFSAEKVDSSYIKKNGKRNVSPLKKIISFALALSLISSSGVAISKLYKEKHNDFDISDITFAIIFLIYFILTLFYNQCSIYNKHLIYNYVGEKFSPVMLFF